MWVLRCGVCDRDLCWSVLVCVGLCWPVLACVGLCWPVLACVGLWQPRCMRDLVGVDLVWTSKSTPTLGYDVDCAASVGCTTSTT
jgi:hypothetical protein